jgi:DNA polymerase III subunit delta'
MPPWLESEYRRLLAALDAGRLAHALLFHGPPGWGQLQLASATALAVIGRTREVNGGVDAATLAHPDLRWLAPEGAGGQIKIDEIRRLTHFVLQTSHAAGRKAAIISDAGAINLQAANALLKTLEEPPAGSHLLLVTSSLAELLPTIRSRCQLIAVRPAAPGDAIAWVASQRPRVVPGVLDALAFEFGHAPIRLLEALDRDEEPVGAALEAVFDGSAAPAGLLDRWAKLDTDSVLERWMRYLVDAVGARRAGRLPRLSALADVPEDALHRFWEDMIWARQLVRSTSNPHLRMLLETILLKWRDLRHATVV